MYISILYVIRVVQTHTDSVRHRLSVRLTDFSDCLTQFSTGCYILINTSKINRIVRSMKCLLLFAHESDWLDFKYPELDGLLRMNGLDPVSVYSQEQRAKNSAFLIANLPNEAVCQSILSRSVTIKAIVQLFSSIKNSTTCDTVDLAQLIEEVNSNFADTASEYITSKVSWSLQIESIYASITNENKQYFRQQFPCLQTLGTVNVSNPSLTLWLLLDFKLHEERPVDVLNHALIPAYFGRLICHSKNYMRDVISQFELKKRLYLGPTSLDHSLAFLLSNIAQVRHNDVVYDPFVGTASILIAMAHYGCLCFGSDIDTRVLHGNMYAGKADRSKDTTKRDIFANFKAYNLSPPELIRLDNHACDRHFKLRQSSTATTIDATPTLPALHSPPADSLSALAGCGGDATLDGFFDVIATDPPYGIRAGAKKTGRAPHRGQVDYEVTDEQRDDHIPSTQNYPVEEVMLDLMHTAA